MRSRACVDQLIRQSAALGAAAHGPTIGILGAVERARFALAFDWPSAARVSLAVNGHVASTQVDRPTARGNTARQLRAARVPVNGGLATVCASAVHGTGRRRIAIERPTGSLSQTIDLTRRVGRAADPAGTGIVAADHVTCGSGRAADRIQAFPGTARDHAGCAVTADPALARLAEGRAAGASARTKQSTRAAARNRVLAIGAQR